MKATKVNLKKLNLKGVNNMNIIKKYTKDFDVYDLLKTEAQYWVRSFSAVPQSVVRKLIEYSDYCDMVEVTPYDDDECESIEPGLPMWGTLWAFGDICDIDWISGEWSCYGNSPTHEEALQIMKDCGFRIYESEDYQYLFGIDGAGYDFYLEHWIPLYIKRGLKWHENTEKWTKLCEKYGVVK